MSNKDINILVVEDNQKIRTLLCNILNNVGYKNLTEAENGKEAFEKLQKTRFDLVLTDWMMPEMSGLELLKAIRNGNNDFKKVPVLMITASDSSEDVVEAAAAKVNGYIIKPFSVKTVVAKIEEVLS